MVQAQGAAPALQAPYCEDRSPEPQMCTLLSTVKFFLSLRTFNATNQPEQCCGKDIPPLVDHAKQRGLLDAKLWHLWSTWHQNSLQKPASSVHTLSGFLVLLENMRPSKPHASLTLSQDELFGFDATTKIQNSSSLTLLKPAELTKCFRGTGDKLWTPVQPALPGCQKHSGESWWSIFRGGSVQPVGKDGLCEQSSGAFPQTLRQQPDRVPSQNKASPTLVQWMQLLLVSLAGAALREAEPQTPKGSYRHAHQHEHRGSGAFSSAHAHSECMCRGSTDIPTSSLAS
ncbi:hypothetical protein Anapl_11541 [Anas platyrhynchos]|uniref:Uncharacterized protein n=1 Tax=Anas platyrhynchos TaxID=8839 RepID=R0JPA0_ANAPL|nr:hypothetical protein Anapl_11541 [Anas platyrhynchos]